MSTWRVVDNLPPYGSLCVSWHPRCSLTPSRLLQNATPFVVPSQLSELAGDFPHLLQHGRGGVVAAAVHASARLGAGCRAACEALRGALKEGHPKAAKRGVRALVPCLVLTVRGVVGMSVHSIGTMLCFCWVTVRSCADRVP